MIFNIVLQFFTRFELQIQFAKVPFFQTQTELLQMQK
jgi:hypothetical protein